jgi:hypothetical protein
MHLDIFIVMLIGGWSVLIILVMLIGDWSVLIIYTELSFLIIWIHYIDIEFEYYNFGLYLIILVT